MATDALSLEAGQLLGRYELLASVAKGGMGQVWVGRLRGARGFQKLVAVKTVLPATGNEERLDRMLFEEARIAALIQHPNVVQTLELGEHQGALYLVMEWVDGEPLSYLLRHCAPGGGMPLAVAVNLIAQTLRGLQAAHELTDQHGAPLGVVHRDVSPHNVLVSYSGVAKLVDFGIAKAMNQNSSSTTTGEIKGKFAYMAPEQILGGVVDRRADVFAVGIMLYLLTTGRHPFKNHDSAGVLHSISSEEPAPHPSSSLPHYSPALEAVVMKAIAKAPNQRWASADEMRVALQGAVPEAFGLDFEVELGNFLTTQLGERASSKREAMRQAELASELRGQESGALAGPAQSASSLRAVSVDNLFQVRERSILATLRPAEQTASPPPRGKWRPALVGISVGAALLLTLVSLHALRGEHVTAASSGAGLVELNTNLGPSQPAAPIVPHEATPSPSALAPVAPAESSALPTPKRGPAKRMKAHAGLGPHAPSTDLIAPDYAR